MKKILVFLAAIAASLALVSCGGSSSGGNDSARKVDEANEILVQLLNRFNMCTGGFDSGPVFQLTNDFIDAYGALDENGKKQVDDEIAKRGKDAPDFLDYLTIVGLVDGTESIADMAYRYYTDWNADYDNRSANERRIKRLKMGMDKEQKAEFKEGRTRFSNDFDVRLPYDL